MSAIEFAIKPEKHELVVDVSYHITIIIIIIISVYRMQQFFVYIVHSALLKVYPIDNYKVDR